MNNHLATGSKLRQIFLRTLIEVEIPEYGLIKLRNPSYGPSDVKLPLSREEGSAREFCAKLISALIVPPLISWNEVQNWDDQSIQKALRAWIEKANKNKFSLPEGMEFFDAVQRAYINYLNNYVQELNQLIQPILQRLTTYFNYFNQGIYELVEAMLNNEKDISGEAKFINQRKNELWSHLPEFSEDVFFDGELPHNSYFINANPKLENLNNIEVLNYLLEQTRANEFSLSLETFFQRSPSLKDRWRFVEKALLAHNDENYIISIPILLIHLEGIYTVALIAKNYAIKFQEDVYKNNDKGTIQGSDKLTGITLCAIMDETTSLPSLE